MEIISQLAEITSGWIPVGLIIIGVLYGLLAIINFCIYNNSHNIINFCINNYSYDDEALIRGWCSTISAIFVIVLRVLYGMNLSTAILVVTIVYAIASIIMVIVQWSNDCIFSGIGSALLNTVTVIILLLQVAAAIVAAIAGIAALILGGIFVKGRDE